MSSENLNPNPPWDDQRITAYVMNELTGEERESFETELNENETLAEAVAEAREVTAKLSGFYASIPEEQLDAIRRAELSDESEPAVTFQASSSFKPMKLFFVAASIVFVVAVLTYPAINGSMQTAQTDGVAFERDSELRLLESAIDESAPFAEEAPFEAFDRSEDLADVMAQPAVATELSIPDEVAAAATRMVEGRSRNSTESKLAKSMDSDKRKPILPPTAPTPSSGDDPNVLSNREMPIGREREAHGLSGKLRVAYQLPEGSDDISIALSPMPHRGIPGAVESILDSTDGQGPGMGGDKYDLIVENTFKRVSEHPLSTLSIDVDTASYSKVRMSLRGNRLPQPDAVRIEEMLNYFEYDYSENVGVQALAAKPENEPEDRLKATLQPHPFVAGMAVADCPWTPEHRLVRVGLQAIELEKKERPQCNLVFLIDTSGSMRASNKLPLVIDGMKLLLKELRPDDRVAIVVYAGSAGLVLDSTPAKKKKKIINALSKLQSGGSTNGGAGLRLAYETARENFSKKGVNRVILCSDGDFNVGMTGTEELVREAKSQAKSGVDLTVLGFGMGNHNDAMMERISNDAEGNYGFIDSIAEAKKVLVDQLTGTLVTVAKDVKIQIEFNPEMVSSYRLIGYENRVLAKEDFNDDKIDAGEIGAGHRVTALYEVVPQGKLPAAIRPAVNPLKYQPDKNADLESGANSENETVADAETLTLHLRYKPPQGDTSTEMIQELVDQGQSFAEADADFRFAAAVAGFGMQLRNSEHAGRWTYDDVIEVARSAKGIDPHGLRAEMVELAEKARSLTINE